MPTMDIEALNRAIKEAGADWVATETPYSRLAGRPGNIEGMGLSLTPEDEYADLLAARGRDEALLFAAVAPPPLPSAIDWRQHRGGRWVTPVRDQGACGACIAFSAIATIESRVLIAENRPDQDFDLSEAALFHCGNPNGCAKGWQFVPALQYAEHYGLGREASFPYTPGNQACRVVPVVVRTGQPASAAMMTARKRAVVEGPVMAGLAVYDDFFNYSSGVYRHISGNLAGYHAVCVVGYDDEAGCWIVKNSWSDRWGDNGFFRIRYGECGIDSQFAFHYPDYVALVPGTAIP